jgi:hypothetical protein
MPILKWKQGEQITLRELDSGDQSKMMPLLELLPFKDIPNASFKDSFKAEQLKTAVKLIKADFDQYPIAIDTLLMAPGYPSQTKLMITTLLLLKSAGVNAVPVIHPGMILAEPAEFQKLQLFGEVVLRIRTGTLLPIQVDNLITALRSALGTDATTIHILLDMHDIVGSLAPAKVAEVEPLIKAAMSNENSGSVIFAGGAFPMSLAGIAQGSSSIARVDYQAYRLLQGNGYPDIIFGDYAVTNPILLEGLDPTKMNPSVQIRYTRDMDWLLLKAGGSKTHGMGQYIPLCNLLVAHKDYSGNTYSYGDGRYFYHTQAGATSGSYMTWRRDATSHHLAFTVRQQRLLLGI